jgi:hypothetical protein
MSFRCFAGEPRPSAGIDVSIIDHTPADGFKAAVFQLQDQPFRFGGELK